MLIPNPPIPGTQSGILILFSPPIKPFIIPIIKLIGVLKIFPKPLAILENIFLTFSHAPLPVTCKYVFDKIYNI